MRRASFTAAVALCLLLAGCGGSAKSGEDLYVAGGSASGSTGRFAPAGAWDLDYTWDCSKAISEGVPGVDGIDAVIYNSDDASTAYEHPEVKSPLPRGKGVLHYQRGGDYYVSWQTRCDWTIDVVARS